MATSVPDGVSTKDPLSKSALPKGTSYLSSARKVTGTFSLLAAPGLQRAQAVFKLDHVAVNVERGLRRVLLLGQ